MLDRWWVFALGSALSAAATAIFAKIGVGGIPSNLAIALRTTVVIVFVWGIAFATRGSWSTVTLKPSSLVFLALSGITTGLSWIAYFKALERAPASRVAPVDKLSLAFTILLAGLVLGEAITWKVALGVALIVAGAVLTISP